MSKTKMQRNLKARHISMMAIGGAIGTGLFMASGVLVAQAGSYKSILAYLLIGVFIYFLMSSLGEMASFYPVSGSVSSYSERFVDSSLGFAVGWLYWFMWVLVTGIDIITLAKVLQFWEFFQNYSTLSICLFFLILLFIVNISSVKIFGEVEYWLTIIKVLVVIFFLLAGTALIFGIIGAKTYGMNTFIDNSNVEGAQGFLGFFAVLSTAAFSFGGTESVVIAAGESNEPEKTMPKAVNQVFWRILIFYIATMFIISAVISVNDPRLLDTSNILASPFTIVFENAGYLLAASVMNAVICTSVLSAGNSGIYFASRQLYSLSTRSYAPKIFSKLSTSSSPQYAVIFSAFVVIVSFLFEKYSPKGYYTLLSIVGILVVCIWIIAIFSQIRLRKSIKAQNKDISTVLPYKAKFGIIGSYIALLGFILLVVLQIYSDLKSGGILKAFYDSLPILLILVLWLGHKIVYKTNYLKLNEIDLDKFKK
ncbi:amino acid permease [Gemelliphila palaticanis]|uniref:Amino acid permease n=1 Tax=Gemelliphila palaticanis TaxID=81950 RepID=A0ABX2SY17_9BACL|nr:amino acid permease [Gemella palaticanis]MBF0715155.1 amino acid permease [Gemella palaticanis]NYS47085.1 amino acid permease [Gemella palaticanis]